MSSQTPEEMKAIIRASMPDARLRQIEEYIATLPADMSERVEIERRLPNAWKLVEDNKPGQVTARMIELETLHRLVERAAARMWAEGLRPDIERGRKVLDGTREGHVAVHGSATDKAARWCDLQARLNSVLERRPRLSLTAARRIVASETGYSYRTVQRRTTRP